MQESLQLPARTVARLLADIYGPAIYDLPRYGGGLLQAQSLLDAVSGPFPDPWRRAGLASGQFLQPWSRVTLNPQPLPPKELYAVALADAYIQDVLELDHIAAVFGGEAEERGVDRSMRLIAEVDDICPEWPWWRKHWPVPPRPPWEEKMNPSELLIFGSRFLMASELAEHGQIQDALAGLGEKAMGLSMQT